jgi:hypothetical protein
LRAVEVGLKDLVDAEIRSGLQEGEVVRLAAARTSPSSGQNSDEQMEGPMGGAMGVPMDGGGMGGPPPGGP